MDGGAALLNQLSNSVNSSDCMVVMLPHSAQRAVSHYTCLWSFGDETEK
jgi:hypothetical protein